VRVAAVHDQVVRAAVTDVGVAVKVVHGHAGVLEARLAEAHYGFPGRARDGVVDEHHARAAEQSCAPRCAHRHCQRPEPASETRALALLAPYLDELAHDRVARAGQPTVLLRRLAAQNWDGNRLPGPWLCLRALEAATIMARECGTGTVVIRRSHHIACLAAYLK